MWSERKPWWVKKAKENKVDKTHYKDWCVIEVYQLSTSNKNVMLSITKIYKPVAKINAPKVYDFHGDMSKAVVVNNLTKQEAYEVAKGLNFLDGGKCEQ